MNPKFCWHYISVRSLIPAFYFQCFFVKHIRQEFCDIDLFPENSYKSDSRRIRTVSRFVQLSILALCCIKHAN